MPTPTSCFQSALPLVRSMQMASRVFATGSTELTKTRFSQTIGVAAEGPGISAAQRTFSVLENRAGKPVSLLDPLKNGPRHWGQFSAQTAPGFRRTTTLTASNELRIRWQSFIKRSRFLRLQIRVMHEAV